MTLDQMASELRGIPDAALQQQAQKPGEMPGYLVANEILRRQQERSQPQQQGNQGPQPTILSQLARNLPPPQAPQVKAAPEIPFQAVPQRNLAGAVTHFDSGGYDSPDTSDEVASNNVSDVPAWSPPTSGTPMSEKVPAGVNVNAPGAYSANSAPPVTNYPQTSQSPLQNPPNTHQGGRGFLQTLASLAPAMQYLGNIGAGAAMPHGNFATGVGYANQVMEREQELKDAAAERAAERAQQLQFHQEQMGMQGQQMQAQALMSGAKFVGPDGKVQEAPVMSPTELPVNGVSMGAPSAPIPGSGSVPMNPQMTQLTGAPGINARPMDYSDILTEQKKIEEQKLAREEEAQLRIQEQAAIKQQTWIAAPKELAQYLPGIKEGQMVPPSIIEEGIKKAHPAVIPFNKTDENGNVTVGYFDPNATPDKQVVMKTVPGVAPSKNDLTAYQKAQLAIEQQRLGLEAQKANKPNDNELDRLTARYAKPYETSNTAAQAQLEKISDARAMINGNAESQALGIPKILTALVSGQGSGVRITQPELNSIAKARGVGGDVEGFFNRISGQGTLTDTQKQQMTGILDDVAARLKQKQAIANEAIDKINGSASRDEVLENEKTYRNKLNSFENQGGGGQVVKAYDPKDPNHIIHTAPAGTALPAGWIKVP